MARGILKEKLAELAEVHHTYVSMIERGVCPPTNQIADRLAHALGTKLSTLIPEAERRNLR